MIVRADMAAEVLTPKEVFVKEVEEELRRLGEEVDQEELRRRCGERWGKTSETERKWFEHLAKKEQKIKLKKRKHDDFNRSENDQPKTVKLSMNSAMKDIKQKEMNDQGMTDNLSKTEVMNREMDKEKVKRQEQAKQIREQLERVRLQREKIQREKDGRTSAEKVAMLKSRMRKEQMEKVKLANEKFEQKEMMKEKTKEVARKVLPAFYWYCEAERGRVSRENPGMATGAVTKVLCLEWAALAQEGRARYTDGRMGRGEAREATPATA